MARRLLRTIKFNLSSGTTRSEANVTLNIIAYSPGSIQLCREGGHRAKCSEQQEVTKRVADDLARFQDWQQLWEPILYAGSDEHQNGLTAKTLLAIFYMYTLVVHRLCAAAPARAEQRLSSETQAPEEVDNALQIAAQSQLHNGVSQTRVDIVLKFAHSVIATSNVWRQALTRTLPDLAIDRTLSMDWCAWLVGKVLPNPRSSALSVVRS